MAIIRLAQANDIEMYWEHVQQHVLESGRDGDFIFSPKEAALERTFADFQKSHIESWSRRTDEVGWQRTWLLFDGAKVFGDLNLVHSPRLITSLHRATLMMGIQRSHRNQGYGSQFIAAAIDWAKTQVSIDWLQLYVFENNIPAKKLYKKFGFQENGTTPDLFRVFGKSIDDTSMILKLRNQK